MFLAFHYYTNEEWADNGIAFLAIVAILCITLWQLLRRMGNSKPQEPWDEEVASSVEAADAQPLCIHCLTPHRQDDYFCEKCGGPVGDLTNYMIPDCYLSWGHVLRAGAEGDFKRSPGAIAFFFLAIFTCFKLIFVPFYWLRLASNLERAQKAPPPEPRPVDPPEQSSPPPPTN